MRRTIQILAMVMMFLPVSVLSWVEGTAAVQPIADTERPALFPTRDMIEFGEGAAEASCFSCHGADGISDSEGKPHLAGQRTVYLYRVLKAFQSGDRPDEQHNHNKFLNDKALIATAVYYSSLTPAQLPVVVETDHRLGPDGEEGNADDVVYPPDE